MSLNTTPREQLLQQAADWLVRLDNGQLNTQEQQAFSHWYHTSPEHERIWQTACELNRQFANIPGQLAKPVLGRPRASRRTLLKSLAAISLLPTGWILAQHQPWQPWLADHRTRIGERRSLVLEDGSELTLNTDTALDVAFTGQQRQIRLYQGELLVKARADAQRPFILYSSHGSVITQDGHDATTFAVRCQADISQVTVVQQAVWVRPVHNLAGTLVSAGQACRFNQAGIEWLDNARMSNALMNSLAWKRGELIADHWPLGDFLAELARYRPGILRCDPAITGLAISGVFQTQHTDQALDVLEALFGLQVTRITPYWVSVGMAS